MNGMVYFSTRNSNRIPRVVAATIKAKYMKNESILLKNSIISGDLRVVKKSMCYLRYGEVRNGCLVLYKYVKFKIEFDYQIPLHDLNISLDSPKYRRQFSLTKYDEITPVATFQVIKIEDYDKWLKTLAVEIIRQTPLNTLKFLDVLFVNELLERAEMKKTCRTRDSFAMTLPIRRSFEKSSRKIILDYNRNETAPPDDEKSDFNHFHSINSVVDFDHRLPPSSQKLSNIYNFDTTLTVKSSSDSVDSGFCSLQSSNGKYDQDCSPKPNRKYSYHRSQNFAVVESKPNIIKEILQRFESTSASVPTIEIAKPKRRTTKILSSSCYKLINKIKKYSPNKTKIPVDDNSSINLENHFQEDSTHLDKIIENRFVNDAVRLNDENTRMSNEIRDLYWSKIKQDGKNSSRKTSASVNFNLPEELLQNEDANALVRLLTKCQIDKQYVTVKEKRLLFESLSKFSFSVDNLKKRKMIAKEENLKSCSLCNLLNIPVSVKVMKNYFENFDDQNKDVQPIIKYCSRL